MTDDRLGSRRTPSGSVDDAFAAVDIPMPAAEHGSIDVAGYAYNDEPGEVELRIGDRLTVEIVLDADRARELAATLTDAADDAEAEL